jgi:hypothetical protein
VVASSYLARLRTVVQDLRARRGKGAGG